jgi:transposase
MYQARFVVRWIKRHEFLTLAGSKLSLPTEFVSVENWKPTPDAYTERERLTRRAQRLDRYEQVMALRAQGLGNAEIARRVGLTARTLQNWQKKGSFPEAERRRKRPSRFDPYAPYVLSRWEHGCHNGSQLYREIKAQGYTGQERQVHRFFLPLRKKVRIIQKAESGPIPLPTTCATRWWKSSIRSEERKLFRTGE